MNRIKKFLGLVSIGILFVGTILGIITSRKESTDFVPAKSVEEKGFSIPSLSPTTEIESKQPQYICREDFLAMDENDLAFEYSNLEVVECVGVVGCATIF